MILIPVDEGAFMVRMKKSIDTAIPGPVVSGRLYWAFINGQGNYGLREVRTGKVASSNFCHRDELEEWAVKM